MASSQTENARPPQGVVALMGSGELTATMVEVHKALLRRLGDRPRAVFLDTPAGFQLNADQIAKKARAYFRERVGHPLGVASFRRKDLPPLDAAEAFRTLRAADYVLVGPGSPTYALRHWKGSPVPDILLDRVRSGGCLVAASAAALTVGRYTLPVYEIYKVGEEPVWIEGLDLLGRLGLDLVVVPHWNNAEGGTHDTRFCYMGEPRFRALEAQLPPGQGILGIDEHTAVILDFGAGRAEVRGLGAATLRRDGRESRFPSGRAFPLDAFGPGAAPGEAVPIGAVSPEPGPAAGQPGFWNRVRSLEESFHRALTQGDARGAVQAVLDLDRWVMETPDESDRVEAREVLREAVVSLGAELATRPASREACLAPLVEDLVRVRERFRREGRWAEADALREALGRAGVTVEDTPEGPRWRWE
ncbi:MAG: type 1 glutamine amidotransferase-like domain-containing protein [Deltaproteobacteria bacterium]|nr:type 1 glutamine amidotransferase-like domain-containing protein [Deltaproteobacteria bacterium]